MSREFFELAIPWLGPKTPAIHGRRPPGFPGNNV
jgi:hypothetical protein